jgi:single-stranded DNA-specific DHH superfamily exonuclease
MNITFAQSREFLESITEKDKVAIFTHKDLDGFAAGILFQDFCEKKGCKKVQTFIIDYGMNKISDYNLDEFNIGLASDLAPSSVVEDFAKIKDKKIFYTDHHPKDEKYKIPDEVSCFITTSQGYLPSTRTVYELTEKENKEKLWLATLGTLSDMAEKYPENKDFLENAYKKLGTNQEEMLKYLFKLNFALVGSPSLEKAFEEISKLENLEDIVKLSKYYEPVEKEFARLEKDYENKKERFNKIVYYYIETAYPGLKSAFINAISTKEPDKALVFTTTKKNSTLSLSSRNQSREYNVSKLLQDCLAGLKEGWAGGHKSAAGGQLDKSDLEKFKQKLKNYDVESAKI